jgi:hypothetical protein
LTNTRSFNTEGTLTYLWKKYVFGANLIVDAKASALSSFDFGWNWTPVAGANFGIKHSGPAAKPLSLGRFWVYFNHAASATQTVGTEFSYDWAHKDSLAAKLGVSQKFNDATSGKFKVDNQGQVDAVLKHKYNETVTASLATGFSFRGIVASGKSKAFPVGLAFDFKF